jgi:hypothetical protein
MDRDLSHTRRDRRRAVTAAARIAAVALTFASFASRAVAAGPGEAEGAKGLYFAKRGDCDRAVRSLEAALRALPAHARPS